MSSSILALICSILFSIASQSAIAFIYPLQPESVREAYFLGRSDRAKVAEFLGKYTRTFQPRSGGVGRIELQTPYEQIVLRSWENQTGYSAQQAQIDYAVQPGIVVRVFLYLGWSVLDRRENFWRDFQFRVTQERAIEPNKVESKPIYSRRGRGLSGAVVSLEFDAAQFVSGGTKVEVTAPDQQIAVGEFNLDKLK
jgi:hypothetical protein